MNVYCPKLILWSHQSKLCMHVENYFLHTRTCWKRMIHRKIPALSKIAIYCWSLFYHLNKCQKLCAVWYSCTFGNTPEFWIHESSRLLLSQVARVESSRTTPWDIQIESRLQYFNKTPGGTFKGPPFPCRCIQVRDPEHIYPLRPARVLQFRQVRRQQLPATVPPSPCPLPPSTNSHENRKPRCAVETEKLMVRISYITLVVSHWKLGHLVHILSSHWCTLLYCRLICSPAFPNQKNIRKKNNNIWKSVKCCLNARE